MTTGTAAHAWPPPRCSTRCDSPVPSIPSYPSHRIDVLLDYLDIPRPTERHRAMADVEATAKVFIRLLDAGSAFGLWRTLRDITARAGLEAKAGKPPRPTQDAMF